MYRKPTAKFVDHVLLNWRRKCKRLLIEYDDFMKPNDSYSLSPIFELFISLTFSGYLFLDIVSVRTRNAHERRFIGVFENPAFIYRIHTIEKRPSHIQTTHHIQPTSRETIFANSAATFVDAATCQS